MLGRKCRHIMDVGNRRGMGRVESLFSSGGILPRTSPLFLLIVLGVCLSVPVSAQVTWSARQVLNTNATTDAGLDYDGALATDGAGNWVALWTSEQDQGGAGTDADIFVTYSDDDGTTWHAPSALNSNATLDTAGDVEAFVETDGAGNWVAVWYSLEDLDGAGTDADIFVARSTDNGASWSTVAGLNTNASSDAGIDRDPRLATDGSGTWLVVWASDDDTTGLGDDNDILIARSTDDGATWSAPALLNMHGVDDHVTDTYAEDLRPQIAHAGGDVWIAAWDCYVAIDGSGEDGDIAFSRSEDGGITWSAAQLLNSSGLGDGANDRYVRLAGDGAGNWVAVWDSTEDYLGAGTDADIFHARSSDNGATWMPTSLLNTNATTDADSDGSPEIAVDAVGTWVAVWYAFGMNSGASSNLDVLAAYSVDYGATWTTPAVVPSVPADSWTDLRPRVAASGIGQWLLVWDHFGEGLGSGNDGDLFFAKGTSPDPCSGPPGDTTPPIALCRDISLGLDVSGMAVLVPEDVDAGSNDACGIATMSVTPNTFSCADKGMNLVTLTVTDASGNSSMCTATVNVTDPFNTCGGQRFVWSDPKPVDVGMTTDTGSDYIPTVAADGQGNWLVAWWDFVEGVVGTSEWKLKVARSTDNGVTWGTPTVLDTSALVSFAADFGPQAISDGAGHWVLVWSTNDPTHGGGTDYDLIVSHSIDGGATWTTPALMLPGAASDVGEDRRPHIAVDGAGNWVALWDAREETVAGDAIFQIWAARSSDGYTWTSPELLGSNGRSMVPRIATDGTGRWVSIWHSLGTAVLDTEMWVATSDDFGATWTTPKAISDPGTVPIDHYGRLATDGSGDWVVTWDSHETFYGNVEEWDIHYVRSNDDGDTWTLEAPLNAGPLDDCGLDWTPFVAVDAAGNWVVLWTSVEDTSGTGSDEDIFVAYSTDGGVTWASQGPLNTNAAWDAGDDIWPQLATDNQGHWVAVWQSNADVDGAGDDVDILVSTGRFASPPTAVCQNISVELDASGMATIAAADVDGGSYDDVGIASWSLSRDTFTCDDLGENPVTLTVTDTDGMTDTCLAVVTVMDKTNPCEQDVLTWAATGVLNTNAASESLPDTDPQIATDSAGNWVVVWKSYAGVGGSGIDADILTARSTDIGATWSAPQLLNQTGVGDGSNDGSPQIAADGAGNWVVVWQSESDPAVTTSMGDVYCSRSTDAGATWSYPEVISTEVAGPEWDFGPQVATDRAGNWTVLWQRADDSGEIDARIVAVHSSDGGATWSDPRVYGTGVPGWTLGKTNVQLAGGNAGEWVAVLHSTENPCGAAADRDIFAMRSNSDGQIWTPPSWLNTNASSDMQSDYFPHVATNGHGNWVTVWQTREDIGGAGTDMDLFVARSTDGGVSWSDPALLNLNAAVDGVGDYYPRVVSDGAGRWVGVWQSYTTGSDGDVSFTYSDDNGLTWTPPRTLNDTAGTDTGDDWYPQVATDGAGHWVAVWHSSEDHSGAGTDLDIFVTSGALVAPGVCGVSDVTPPVAACRDIAVSLDPTGNVSIVATDVNGGSMDDCGIASMHVSPDRFTCADVGLNLVTLTVVDTSGNLDTCQAMVTVEDNLPPVMICRNATVQLDSNGTRQIIYQYVDGGSYDNCMIASRQVSPDTFTCSDLGANTVTLTISDAAGNMNSCQTTVNVQDSIPPVARCRDIAVMLDEAGVAGIVGADVDDGSTDNCGVSGLTVSPDVFTADDLGENTVTLTVSDASGNEDTCESAVTVVAYEPPCDDARTLVFPDAALEAAVRSAIGKPFGPLQVGDVLCVGFTTLEAPGAGIADLTGLEYCRDLEVIDLTGNAVAGTTPVAALPHVRVLRLNQNNIVDIAPLATLTTLEELRLKGNALATLPDMSGLLSLRVASLGNNALTDLTPLQDLPAIEELGLVENAFGDGLQPLATLLTLRTLWLDRNDVGDLGPLSGLSQLEVLHAEGCLLTELFPLAALTSLQALYLQDNEIAEVPDLQVNAAAGGLGAGDVVYLTGNPLIMRACEVQIPAIRDAGAEVFHDTPCLEDPPPIVVTIQGPRFPVAGSPAELWAYTSGFEPAGFDWLKDGEAIPDATLNTLRFDPVALADSGVYQVMAYDDGKAVYSSPPYVLTVLTAVPGVGGLIAATLMLGLGLATMRRRCG